MLHTALKVQITSGFQHHYIKWHHPTISPSVNPSSSRNQRTPGMGEILWEQQMEKNPSNFKMCFKARFSNVPNGRSKYQLWNVNHLAGKFVGGRCQVGFGTCAEDDKSCLEECPLRWTGQEEGECSRSCQLAAHSRGPGGKDNFSGLHLYQSQAWSSQVLPRAAWKCSAPMGAWDRGLPGGHGLHRTQQRWSQAREGRDTARTMPNLLLGWVSFSGQYKVLVEKFFVQHKTLKDILFHWLCDSCNHS